MGVPLPHGEGASLGLMIDPEERGGYPAGVTAEALKEMLNAAPFVPFLVHLPDRPPMRIPHPDFAHLSPKGKTMHVWLENGEGFRVIDVALVTQLEPRAERRRSKKG